MRSETCDLTFRYQVSAFNSRVSNLKPGALGPTPRHVAWAECPMGLSQDKRSARTERFAHDSVRAHGNCNSTLAFPCLCAITPPGARAYMRECAHMLAHARMRTHVIFARAHACHIRRRVYMCARAYMRHMRAPATCMRAWSVPYCRHGQALWQLAVCHSILC